MSRNGRAFSALSVFTVLSAAGCASHRNAGAPTRNAVTLASSATASAAHDAKDSRPPVADATPFVPPAPVAFDGPNGIKVWLLERHTLPIAAVTLVVPYGGASDPSAHVGLAHLTADMLDEGAGTRDAVAFSTAVDELGARLLSGTDRDASYVTVESTSDRLPAALALVGDAVARPRHAAGDFARVRALWKNGLRARGDDPNEVARIVSSAAFFGPTHPYGRPLDGSLRSTDISLGHITAFHRSIWRPDVATLVAVGDITREQLASALTTAFGSWARPTTPPPPVVTPALSAPPTLRTVVVDRPEAPQVVLSILRAGVPATSDAIAPLDLVNLALGGSFTSRLNQNLREDHGWTYGAHTRFVGERSAGVFVARASIRTDAITDALREARREIRSMASGGLTLDELTRTKAQARADAVAAYGSLGAIATGLASDAGLGLAPGTDAKHLAMKQTASLADVNQLASTQLPLETATIVMVGPRGPIEAAFAAEGLPAPETRDTNGDLVARASPRATHPK